MSSGPTNPLRFLNRSNHPLLARKPSRSFTSWCSWAPGTVDALLMITWEISLAFLMRIASVSFKSWEGRSHLQIMQEEWWVSKNIINQDAYMENTTWHSDGRDVDLDVQDSACRLKPKRTTLPRPTENADRRIGSETSPQVSPFPTWIWWRGVLDGSSSKRKCEHQTRWTSQPTSSQGLGEGWSWNQARGQHARGWPLRVGSAHQECTSDPLSWVQLEPSDSGGDKKERNDWQIQWLSHDQFATVGGNHQIKKKLRGHWRKTHQIQVRTQMASSSIIIKSR